METPANGPQNDLEGGQPGGADGQTGLGCLVGAFGAGTVVGVGSAGAGGRGAGSGTCSGSRRSGLPIRPARSAPQRLINMLGCFSLESQPKLLACGRPRRGGGRPGVGSGWGQTAGRVGV